MVRGKKLKKQKKSGARPNATRNERLILSMMKKTNMKGNPRDYVLITGKQLIDSHGSYDVKVAKGEATEEKESDFIAVVHKRRLVSIIGKELAGHFWNSKLGMRVPQRPGLPAGEVLGENDHAKELEQELGKSGTGGEEGSGLHDSTGKGSTEKPA